MCLVQGTCYSPREIVKTQARCQWLPWPQGSGFLFDSGEAEISRLMIHQVVPAAVHMKKSLLWKSLPFEVWAK